MQATSGPMHPYCIAGSEGKQAGREMSGCYETIERTGGSLVSFVLGRSVMR